MTFRVAQISDTGLSREKPFSGYVAHRFEPDGSHTSEFVRVPGLERLNMVDFATAAYGERAPPA